MASGGKREIKTTLSLDGEAEFKRALSDASSALKQLNAEEKLAKAQFDQTGNAQEYQAEKTRILKQKIEEQRKVVEKGEKALKAMRDRGIEPSNRAYQTLSTRVINARTRLVTMNTELDRTQSELTETSTAIDSAADGMGTFATSLRTIGQGVSFQSTITAIDNISSHLEGVIRTAGRAVKAVIDMEVDAGKWADTLMTRSSQTGLDVVTLQQWDQASLKIDVDVDTIIKSMDKLGKSVDANTGIATDDFIDMANRIGLEYKDSNNQVLDNATLFWRAIDALHSRYSTGLMNEAQLEDTTQALFGKSFRELYPLIREGSAAYLDYAATVDTVSEDNVKALGEWNDAREQLENGLNVTKMTILAGLADTFTSVAQSLSSVVSSFNDFLATEEGQQMLQSLSDAVAGLVKSFTTDNFNDLVETAATWMERLTDALNWLADPANEGKIKGTLETIGLALGGLHLSKDVLTALMFFRVGKAALFGAGARAAGGAAAGAAGNAAAGAAGAAGGGLGAKLLGWGKVGLTWLGKTAAGVGSVAGAPLTGLALGAATGAALDAAYTERNYGRANAIVDYNEGAYKTGDAGHDAAFKKLSALYQEGTIEAVQQAYDYIQSNRELFNPYLAKMQRNNWDEINTDPARWAFTLDDTVAPAFAELIEIMAEGAIAAENTTKALDHLPSAFSSDHYSSKAGEIAEGLFNEILSGDAARHAAEEATQEVVDIYDNAGRKAAHAAGRAVVEAATGDTGGTASTVNISDAAMATQVLNTLTRWGRSINQDQFDNFANNVFSGTGNTAYYDQFSGIFGSDFFERYGLGGGPGAMQSGFAQMAADIQSAMSGVGTDAATGLKDGIEAGVPDATTAGADLANGAVEGATTALDAHSPSRVMFDLGQNAAIGLANGIDAQLATVQAAAQRLANIVRDVVTTSLMIHSPSQVMAGLGAFTAEGFAEGISASVWRVEDAMDRMIGATQRVPVYRGAGASGGASEGGDIHAYIVMDKEIVGELVAPTVDGVIGATISARR